MHDNTIGTRTYARQDNMNEDFFMLHSFLHIKILLFKKKKRDGAISFGLRPDGHVMW
jgi:hypothetical protein